MRRTQESYRPHLPEGEKSWNMVRLIFELFNKFAYIFILIILSIIFYIFSLSKRSCAGNLNWFLAQAGPPQILPNYELLKNPIRY
jgi:hypothetical protein